MEERAWKADLPTPVAVDGITQAFIVKVKLAQNGPCPDKPGMQSARL